YACRQELTHESTEGRQSDPVGVSVEEALLAGPRSDPSTIPTRSEWDSINKALDALARDRFISLTKNRGRRPARHSYRLMPKGRQLASGFLAERLAQPDTRWSNLHGLATSE